MSLGDLIALLAVSALGGVFGSAAYHAWRARRSQARRWPT